MIVPLGNLNKENSNYPNDFQILFPIPVVTLLCITQSFALYPSNGDVVELTPSNFDKLVVQSDEVWVVEVRYHLNFQQFDAIL